MIAHLFARCNKIFPRRSTPQELNECSLSSLFVLDFLYAHRDQRLCQRDIEDEFFINRATASKMLRHSNRRVRHSAEPSTARGHALGLPSGGLIFIPLLYLLDAGFGLDGINFTQAVVDYISIVLGIILLVQTLKAFKGKPESENSLHISQTASNL